MSSGIEVLRDRHRGDAVTILGRGPSLRDLAEAPTGPVIALNQSIVWLRKLSPAGRVYTMQKDGCYDGSVPIQERHACGYCPSGGMVEPLPSESLIVAADESPYCFSDFSPRYVFDPLADFGYELSSMSSPMAVRIALLMGASRLVMLCHDGFTRGDGRYLAPDGSLGHGYVNAYIQAGQYCDVLAFNASVPIEWVTPIP